MTTTTKKPATKPLTYEAAMASRETFRQAGREWRERALTSEAEVKRLTEELEALQASGSDNSNAHVDVDSLHEALEAHAFRLATSLKDILNDHAEALKVELSESVTANVETAMQEQIDALRNTVGVLGGMDTLDGEPGEGIAIETFDAAQNPDDVVIQDDAGGMADEEDDDDGEADFADDGDTPVQAEEDEPLENTKPRHLSDDDFAEDDDGDDIVLVDEDEDEDEDEDDAEGVEDSDTEKGIDLSDMVAASDIIDLINSVAGSLESLWYETMVPFVAQSVISPNPRMIVREAVKLVATVSELTESETAHLHASANDLAGEDFNAVVEAILSANENALAEVTAEEPGADADDGVIYVEDEADTDEADTDEAA